MNVDSLIKLIILDIKEDDYYIYSKQSIDGYNVYMIKDD